MAAYSYELTAGRSLGSHYEVIDFIGSGWEGEVYKVQERHTGIIRAAKIFYEERSRHGKSLLRYARKLYTLRSCPIVIQYHHRGVTRIRGRNVEFLVSDFVEGEILSTFLKRQKKGSLPPFEALHLIYSLAAGVEAIHFLGEYHGDIHSDNIMVQRRGIGFDLHLVDFFDLGRSTRDKVLFDVYCLIQVFHETLGGSKGYRNAPDPIKQIIKGRKRTLLKKEFKNAGDIRLALDNLQWES